jgi:hypothetical protein
LLSRVIDEAFHDLSVFSTTLSRNVAIGLEGAPHGPRGRPFGGLNVIFCGDLHQFPPVACAKPETLYHPVNLTEDSDDAKIDRRIYEEFLMVVILWGQMHVTEHELRDFLVRLRYAKVEHHDLTMLRSLLLQCSPIHFSSPLWADASLITPRHAVRTQWNGTSLRKVCSENGLWSLVCHVEDTTKN